MLELTGCRRAGPRTSGRKVRTEAPSTLKKGPGISQRGGYPVGTFLSTYCMARRPSVLRPLSHVWVPILAGDKQPDKETDDGGDEDVVAGDTPNGPGSGRWVGGIVRTAKPSKFRSCFSRCPRRTRTPLPSGGTRWSDRSRTSSRPQSRSAYRPGRARGVLLCRPHRPLRTKDT